MAGQPRNLCAGLGISNELALGPYARLFSGLQFAPMKKKDENQSHDLMM
jgi:hypothetical protein